MPCATHTHIASWAVACNLCIWQSLCVRAVLRWFACHWLNNKNLSLRRLVSNDERVIAYLSSGLAGGNGSSCEIHRQEPPPRHRIGRILRRIHAGEEAKQSRRHRSRHRLHHQQPNSPSGLRHHSSLPRPMVRIRPRPGPIFMYITRDVKYVM